MLISKWEQLFINCFRLTSFLSVKKRYVFFYYHLLSIVISSLFLLLMHPIFKLACFCEYVQDNQRIMVSLLMPCIFLAMADSLIDVRLMAFDFLHLVVEYYPATFSLYAEKVCLLTIITSCKIYFLNFSTVSYRFAEKVSTIAGRLQLLPHQSWDTQITNMQNLQGPRQLNLLRLLAWQATLYNLWSERNTRLHQQIFKPPDTISLQV